MGLEYYKMKYHQIQALVSNDVKAKGLYSVIT